MEKSEAFQLLEAFKKVAKRPSHLYDVYHGETEPIVLWFLYQSDEDIAQSIASICFENVHSEEQYIVDIIIGEKLYQMFDYESCLSLIKSIKY